MSRLARTIRRSLVGAGLLAMSGVAGAQSRTTFVDLQAGVGYSTNPLLRLGDSTGSGFGRLSAFAFHGWNTERSATSLSAYVENNTYFNDYDNEQLFNLSAVHSRRISPNATIFGNVGVSGDFGGQLSSRFLGVSDGLVPIEGGTADDLVVVNPDLAALNQRQYRITASAGGSFALTPRDTLRTSVGAQRVMVEGRGGQLDYTSYDASAGYQRQLSERVAAGVRVVANYADYKRGVSITSYGPQATIEARLTSDWRLAAAVGFVNTRVEGPTALVDNDSSIDLAFDGSLCRNTEYERICARFSRRAQSSVLGAAPTSSIIGADYSRRLNARDRLQASLAVVRTGEQEAFRIGEQTFYTLSGSFDRKLNDRLSAGASLSARKLDAAGPDPREDFSGSVFIRHRFGSLR